MQSLAIICNILGLVFDIIGVVGLFYTTLRGLGRIKRPELSHLKRLNIINNEAQALANEITGQLNKIIDQTNKENDNTHRSSKKWLYFIVVGFIFQIFSSAIQFYILSRLPN